MAEESRPLTMESTSSVNVRSSAADWTRSLIVRRMARSWLWSAFFVVKATGVTFTR